AAEKVHEDRSSVHAEPRDDGRSRELFPRQTLLLRGNHVLTARQHRLIPEDTCSHDPDHHKAAQGIGARPQPLCECQAHDGSRQKARDLMTLRPPAWPTQHRWILPRGPENRFVEVSGPPERKTSLAEREPQRDDHRQYGHSDELAPVFLRIT